jgi:hypothetical protein
MEHRWEERALLDQPSRLDARPDLIAVGRLRNGSLSGGYVETAAIVPVGTRLHVELESIHWNRGICGALGRERSCARTRTVSDCEWCDFASRWIALLIHSPLQAQLPVPGADKRNLVDPKAHYALSWFSVAFQGSFSRHGLLESRLKRFKPPTSCP